MSPPSTPARRLRSLANRLRQAAEIEATVSGELEELTELEKPQDENKAPLISRVAMRAMLASVDHLIEADEIEALARRLEANHENN